MDGNFFAHNINSASCLIADTRENFMSIVGLLCCQPYQQNLAFVMTSSHTELRLFRHISFSSKWWPCLSCSKNLFIRNRLLKISLFRFLYKDAIPRNSLKRFLIQCVRNFLIFDIFISSFKLLHNSLVNVNTMRSCT